MWFYEMNSRLWQGLKVDLDPVPQVTIGVEARRTLVLPLGRSIRQFIVGDEADREGTFLLRHGDLKNTTQGLVLVHQHQEAAQRDRRALVLVSFITDPDEGEGIYFRRTGKQYPEVLHERVLVFASGDSIAVHYASQIAPKTTELHWDGERQWMRVRQRDDSVRPPRPNQRRQRVAQPLMASP